MSEQPALWDRMRAHPRSAEMADLADAFEDAAYGYWAEEQRVTAKQFLGHYARARKKWCEVTGEPLV